MRVSSTAFPPGTKVYLHAPGAVRPGEGSDSEESKTVRKDGSVAFEVKGNRSQIGRTAWLAGDVDGEWRTVQVPVKDGKPEDAEDPAETLARVSPAPSTPDEPEPVHGARSTQNTRKRSASDPNEKLQFVSNMSGSEALRVSALGSYVTIPDGSHADPASHEPVVPAHTDGLDSEKRDKLEHGEAKPKPRGPSAQEESTKVADGQPTKKESSFHDPEVPPEGDERTAL